MKGLEDQDEENILALSENHEVDDHNDPEVNSMRQGFRGKRGNFRGNRFTRHRGSYRKFDGRRAKKRHACLSTARQSVLNHRRLKNRRKTN